MKWNHFWCLILSEMNGLVTYDLLWDASGDSGAEFFAIGAEDGTIVLTRSLDRETQSQHHLLVMASDRGNPPLSSTAHIWIRGCHYSNRFLLLYIPLCYVLWQFLSTASILWSENYLCHFVELKILRNTCFGFFLCKW